MEQIKEKYAVGTDVGGSHMTAVVVDLSTGDMLGSPVEVPVDSSGSADYILDKFAQCIGAAITASGVEVRNVGMAFPGPFDYVNGISTVFGVAKYERIFGLDIPSSLSPRLGKFGNMNFRFVNDASAFALGECFGGVARGVRRTMVLTLGTGLGSGFVADNALVESGELVPANGWVYNLPFDGSIADEAFSTRWVCRRFKELTGEAVKGAKEVADRCGTLQEARILFDEYGRRLASFAAPLIVRFGAEMLVLGGNIARAYGHFGSALEKGLADAGAGVPVRVSALMDRAALVGAAQLFAR